MTCSALALVAGLAAVGAHAQQPPPPPDFAPSNLTPAGVRALAANCAACHGTHGRHRLVVGALVDHHDLDVGEGLGQQ